MTKSKISGWKDVYAFTFAQTLKGRSFQMMTIVFCLIALLALPLSGMLTSSSADAGELTSTSIKQLYIADESGIDSADWASSLAGTVFAQIPVTMIDQTALQPTLDTVNKEQAYSIVLHIAASEASYSFEFYMSPDSVVKKNEVEYLSLVMQNAFYESRLQTVSGNEAFFDLAKAPVTANVINADVSASAEEGALTGQPLQMAEYYMMLAGILVLVVILAISGESIASSIVTEKSNKVIEYLMTSIRPLALIIGKVLAILSTTLLQIILILVSVFLSGVISEAMGYNNTDIFASMGISASTLSGVNFVNIVLALISFLLGLMFFAVLAGLAGATVSRIEELAEGIMLFNFSMIVGAYLCIAYAIALMSGSGTSPLALFTILFPLSAPFVLPSGLLLNRISPALACGSIAVQIAAFLLLVLFVSKVYEVLLMYQGNRVKFKAMIAMSKTAKQGGKRHE